MRWDKDQQLYREPDGDNQKYQVPGAIEYDAEGDYWHLSVAITLTPRGSFPRQWVSFVLCVSEADDGKPMARVSLIGQLRQIDFADPQQCNALYDFIVDSTKRSFREGQKSAKAIGFAVGS